MAACFKLPSLAKKPRPPPKFPEFSWKEVRIEAELGCGSFGTRKRKGGSNKPSIEGRHVVRSRVLQPSFMPLSNTISSGHAVPETSDQGGKEGRPLVCNRVLQPSFAPVSSCPPVLGTYVSDQNTTSWPFISPVLRSSLVIVLSHQKYHILSLITLVHKEKASKSRKTHSPRTLSVQSLHQES